MARGAGREVARHLGENEDCTKAYTDDLFHVVCVCLSKCPFLDAMESLFIRSWSANFCVQK